MKQKFNFAKSFLSICTGIAIVMCSLSLFMFSIQSTYAEGSLITPQNVSSPLQVGTAENYIPLAIQDGYAYWLIFNVKDGYKFRKSPIRGGHWDSKTE